MSLKDDAQHDILLIITVAITILFITGISEAISPSRLGDSPTIIL